jgi:hypothetical protein
MKRIEKMKASHHSHNYSSNSRPVATTESVPSLQGDEDDDLAVIDDYYSANGFYKSEKFNSQVAQKND